MDKKDVVELFKIIVQVYPRFQTTAEKVDVWHMVMKRQDFDNVKYNLLSYCETNPYEPTIANIIDSREKKSFRPDSVDLGDEIF